MEHNFNINFWHPDPATRDQIRDAFDALSVINNYTGRSVDLKTHEEKLVDFWAALNAVQCVMPEEYKYLNSERYYSAEHVIELKTVVQVAFHTGSLYAEDVARDVVHLLKKLGATRVKSPLGREV